MLPLHASYSSIHKRTVGLSLALSSSIPGPSTSPGWERGASGRCRVAQRSSEPPGRAAAAAAAAACGLVGRYEPRSKSVMTGMSGELRRRRGGLGLLAAAVLFSSIEDERRIRLKPLEGDEGDVGESGRWKLPDGDALWKPPMPSNVRPGRECARTNASSGEKRSSCDLGEYAALAEAAGGGSEGAGSTGFFAARFLLLVLPGVGSGCVCRFRGRRRAWPTDDVVEVCGARELVRELVAARAVGAATLLFIRPTRDTCRRLAAPSRPYW